MYQTRNQSGDLKAYAPCKCVELYINMNTFTITAANRYKELIQMFCEKALQTNSVYHTNLQTIYLYKYPAIIPVLSKLFSTFVDSNAREKVIMVK